MYFRKEYRRWSALLTWEHGSSLVMLTLGSKEIKPGNSKGNQPWMVIGRTDAEAPVLWLRNVKRQFTGKDSDAGKNWGQEEKGMTEDEMVGWHYWLNGHEFEQALGVGDGQGSWYAEVQVVTKSRTRLSDWTELSKCIFLEFWLGAGNERISHLMRHCRL